MPRETIIESTCISPILPMDVWLDLRMIMAVAMSLILVLCESTVILAMFPSVVLSDFNSLIARA